MRFPFSRYIIHGNSMLPTLKPGDSIISLNWFSNIKIGQIVVAKTTTRLVIKRIKKINRKGRILLVGDNPKETTNYLVGKKDIVGKLVSI